MRRAPFALSLSFAFVFVIAIASVNAQAQPTSSPGRQPPTPASESASVQKQSARNYTLSPEKYEKAIAYSRATYRIHFLGAAYSLALLLILLSLRLAPAFRDRAERISQRRFIQAIVFVPLFLVTFDLLKSPLDAYRHYLNAHYEISVQGWGSWALDWAKGEFIEIIVASILAYILYGMIRRSPRRWWLYFGLASVPMLVFLTFIQPVIIEPLFFKYEPLALTQPALVEQIEKEVQHAGLNIPPERMFEMKASAKLNAIDAYVTGFGSSTRIVVLDTTIAKMETPETLFVVGHEVGHYVLGHIPKGIAFTCALIIVLLLLSYFAINWALARKGRGWAIRGVDDWASFPLILLFLYLFFFLAEPASNTFNRYQEHQADVYGLEVIHGIVPDSAETAAQAFQTLGEVDLADPNPGTLIKVWLYSHPPLADRLTFAHEYDPWSKGQPPMFVR
jgi:Zn-dependent protease with chaperone function